MFETILLPLDGSDIAETALPSAAALAHHFDAKIVLVRIVPSAIFEPDLNFNDLVMRQDRLIQDARDYLSSVCRRPPLNDVSVKAIVLEGPPAETIIEAADRFEADIIVMATHGRGGVERWVLGSVADKVVRGATVPVLLVQARIRQKRSALDRLLLKREE